MPQRVPSSALGSPGPCGAPLDAVPGSHSHGKLRRGFPARARAWPRRCPSEGPLGSLHRHVGAARADQTKPKNLLLATGASAAPARGDLGMGELRSRCQGTALGTEPAAAPRLSRSLRSHRGRGFTPRKENLGPGVYSAASSWPRPAGHTRARAGISGCSLRPWQPARAGTRPSSRSSSSALPALVTGPRSWGDGLGLSGYCPALLRSRRV